MKINYIIRDIKKIYYWNSRQCYHLYECEFNILGCDSKIVIEKFW
jgi:hypothetical protein